MVEIEPTAPAQPAKRGRANAIDAHVGGRVRIRRILLGLSQEKLAGLIGLTFQQVQKYEKGANRISAGRLFQIGRVLDVPVAYFFDEMPEAIGVAMPGMMPDITSAADQNDSDPLTRRETLTLVRAYYLISDERLRNCIRDFVKAAAGVEDAEPSLDSRPDRY